MKRYFISFILPIILVFGLLGCHNSDKQKEVAPNQREEEVADNTTESVYPPTVEKNPPEERPRRIFILST